MKKLILSVFAVVASAGVFADASVERLLVRQQWPWNEKVALDFVLANVASATAIDCAVYRGDTRVNVPAAAFSGDRFELTEDGTYRIMFDPSYLPDRPAKGERLRFALTPSAMTDDDPNREVLYKIFDLENHTVTDVTRGALLSGRYGSVETDYGRIGEGYSTPLSDALIWTGVTNYPGAKTTKLVMRKIPAGTFQYPRFAGFSQTTKYTITVSTNFYIGVFELTQKQFSYTGYNNGNYYNPGELACNLGDDKPVQNIGVLKVLYGDDRTNNWDASAGALKTYKDMFAGAGTYNFDLPTQAMWYRAMRADSTTYYYDGIAETPYDFDSNDSMVVLGRFAGNGGLTDNGDGTVTSNGVVSVGQYRPNAFGLYDMIGNVMEATRDKGADYDEDSTDPYNEPTPLGFGIFGNSWERNAKLWKQEANNQNLHSTTKKVYIGVRLAFFEGENPFQPAE